MQTVSDQPLNQFTQSENDVDFLFIHSPFCGTCHLARKMLETVEAIKEVPLSELNAAVHPDFMWEYQIESVPCLLILRKGTTLEKLYAFHSVPYLYEKMNYYQL
ncbi:MULTISPECIES: thioredoxin family protein [Pontibacillus]|uniref:Thioredoxin family protein n=1 Tax=Pontibacillus chungwhensis TaxID=265426 RepID=A0ABY8UYF8_9BACI|nr:MULTISPECIES: thioredoxin family protein [Pontibacillus]MCD5325187.1 thioredoxin family protein [Pontibacillus sp. HN14]WIF97435.1 thioredoxin family protein [Pontibacillus chungwhensis]